MATEMSRFRETFGRLKLASIYIGGGTPSTLPSHLLYLLFEALDDAFDRPRGIECTFEVNPGTGSKELWQTVLAVGVNRISMGVQAFDDGVLSALGRDHSVADVWHTAAEIAFAGLRNLSIDLMYGLPNQRTESWEETIALALRLNVQHFSVYSLQIEPQTAFAAWYAKGRILLPDEETEREMHDWVDSRLEGAGYRRYEISSWCEPGFEAIHNRIYWHNRPYVGVGTGAHSYFANRRYAHGRSLREYLQEPWPQIPDQEIPLRTEMEDTVFLSLRLTREGLSRGRFIERFGADPRAYFSPEIDRLISLEMLAEYPDRFCLTKRAIPVANDVFAAFVTNSVAAV